MAATYVDLLGKEQVTVHDVRAQARAVGSHAQLLTPKLYVPGIVQQVKHYKEKVP